MEKVLLVGLELPSDREFNDSMEELAELARACDFDPAQMMTQKADGISPKFYIGSGKVQDIKKVVLENDFKRIIFDQELSPVHLRNLERELEVEVLDRTMLILEIFARRARTPEAVLQVQLAESQFLLPRIIGSDTSFSRQVGGKFLKGAGEKQLELDRRMLRNNITRFRHELEEIVNQRRTQRKKRQKDGVFQVALVGYTNAGKSSLLNQFLNLASEKADKLVEAKDKLFETLETTTRAIHVPHQLPFLATDTVGFIRKLPHHLVEAFKSTLEEVKEADLILHVVDISNPDYAQQIRTVEAVLKDIGVENIPVTYVGNKIDRIDEVPLDLPSPHVYISAIIGLGMDELMAHIHQQIQRSFHHVILHVPYEKSYILGELEHEEKVVSQAFTDDYIVIEARLPAAQYGQLKMYVVETKENFQ